MFGTFVTTVTGVADLPKATGIADPAYVQGLVEVTSTNGDIMAGAFAGASASVGATAFEATTETPDSGSNPGSPSSTPFMYWGTQ